MKYLLTIIAYLFISSALQGDYSFEFLHSYEIETLEWELSKVREHRDTLLAENTAVKQEYLHLHGLCVEDSGVDWDN